MSFPYPTVVKKNLNGNEEQQLDKPTNPPPGVIGLKEQGIYVSREVYSTQTLN